MININALKLVIYFFYLLDLGGFSIDESGRITVNSGSAPIGNPPPPQGFHHQPQHDVHVQGDHHQLPESPAAQPVIPHVSCLHLEQQQKITDRNERGSKRLTYFNLGLLLFTKWSKT